ncbi:EamA family transporter [Glutamicibacter halophytocola]|uniref:EamA family transporter n=2 Tax=Micrococcaceae TaxID=1268 RepID=A0ABX5YEN0_9MICC|nr:EamA family transporter [Glutamicibacter sp. FBE19]NQD41992.1 EamA family transporter [Glutamicibacter halophytocola]QDY68146.1 EamA family transporter [Glutamicibacter halophytocola]
MPGRALRHPLGRLALTAIAPVAWGSTYYVTREYLPGDAALWGGVFRALPAGLILLLICRRLPRGSWWWKSLVLGTLNIGAFFALVYAVAQLLPSSIAATTMAVSAGVLMLLAWPLLGERPKRWPLIGAALGFLGVAIMVFDGQSKISMLGILLSLTAMGISSLGFILAKKWSSGQPIVDTTAWQLVAGGLLLLPFAWLIQGPPPALDRQAVLGFGYLSVVATAIAFLAWFSGLRHLPSGTVGLLGLLNPVAGVILGTLLAAESLGIQSLGGMALVLCGVLLGLLANRAQPRISLRDRVHAATP